MHVSRRTVRGIVLTTGLVGALAFLPPYLQTQLEATLSQRHILDVSLPPSYVNEIRTIARNLHTDLEKVNIVVANDVPSAASSGTRLHPSTSAFLVIPQSRLEAFISRSSLLLLLAQSGDGDDTLQQRSGRPLSLSSLPSSDKPFVFSPPPPLDQARTIHELIGRHPSLLISAQAASDEAMSEHERFELAHELAHIKNEDTIKRWALQSALTSGVILLPLGLTRAGVRPLRAVTTAAWLSLPAYFCALSYSRHQELQADVAASKAGYRNGGIETMRFYASVSSQLESSSSFMKKLRSLLSTHPSFEERLEQLSKL